MDNQSVSVNNEQLRYVLLKNPENRSYDDLLVLKGFIGRTEFMQKNLAGIVNPKQMNDLCRQLGLESYNVGDTVFNQGDIGDKVFILLDGACDLRVRYRIDLTQGESEIREKFIKTYKERGSYFGERALQFDEPRSGTVIASAYTSLITVNKNSYISVVKEARLDLSNEIVASAEQLGTKESVITVLSKMRDKRSNQELDAVAGYLFRRIPFFQRFTMPQLIELCRVAETVSVWGRSILFKQGSVGQAFYVVLTGTVEVWVNHNDNAITSSANTTTPGGNRIQHRSQEVTDGLGVKVNQLVSGEIFGERALENEDSLRMASIVTCEGNTELIIISREDYHNLVYVMMHADSMNRLTLLRRTDVFRTVDVQHLKSLARFMEPRKYQLNECLYKVGTKALEIIIIESGECRVETEIREGLDYDEQVELEKQKRNGYRDATHTGGTNTGISTITNSAITTTVSSPMAATTALTEVSNRPFSGGGDGTSPDAHLGSSPQRKFSLPMITSTSTKLKAAAAITAAAAVHPSPQPLSKDPINSVAAKMKLKRLQTQQMIPLGRTHTVNLGRIAPNAVLAMYITTGSLADDIFHPETVIASSLVHAYTIGKHDFFNHLPKDTRFAIEKIIAEYKPPELTSLWQSNPKKMDEELWKKEKAWKLFKHEMSHDQRRNSNILDSYRKLEAVHLSANSGNDRYTMINLKNQALTQSRDMRANGSLVYVDSNWGMRIDTGDGGEGEGNKTDTKTDNKTESGVKAPDMVKRHSDAAKHHPLQHRKTNTQHDAGHVHAAGAGHHDKHGHTEHGPAGHHHNQQSKGNGVHYTDLHERYHADIEAEELVHPLHRHTDRGAHLTTAEIVGTNASLISSAVSHMIRNRLNHAHFGESKLKKELFSIHTEQASALSMESTMGYTTAYDETAQLLGGAPDHGAHAFYLVQMHRESSKNLSGGLLDNAKRMVRCYMRLCGACDSTNAAKKLADTQMENIYLTLFRSDPSKEKELLLNWSAFKGYDSISLSDTDHFLVYCRGAPILFASISPSKNIFNSPFPALCKQRGQRYACIVVNKLNPMHVNKKPTSQPHSEEGSQRHRHHHRAQHSTNDASQDESDSGDEENERRRSSRMPNNHRGGHYSNAVSMTRTDERPPTTSMEQATAVSSPLPVPTAISTKVRPTAISVKARSSSMDNADPTSVPKPSTASDPSSSNSDASVTGTGQLPSSEYLKEFSVLNEVLLTTTSRMECLKYAISRFGTMSDPWDTQGGERPLTAAESEGRAHAKNKIFIRPINSSHPDRILALLHTGRRVCVVPLFNWILVNDDTTRTLDFTNGFNHAAHELVFIEEELEHSRLTALAFGSHDTRSVVGASASAPEKIDTSTTLFKSFAEVGMLHSEHMIDDDNSRYLPKNESIGQHRLTNVRSLQLLERDMTSKEMSQNVIKRVSQGQGDTESVSSDVASLAALRNPGAKRVSTALSASSSLGALRNQENAAHPEARLQALNEVVDSVDKLMGVHDKLCEVEHTAELTAAASGVFHGPVRSPTKRLVNLSVNIPGSTSNSEPTTIPTTINAAVTKHQSLTRTKEMIAKRMNVIESLQNLKFQRVTSDNVMDGYNARVNREIAAAVAAAAQGATPTKRGGKSSNQPNVLAGNLNFNSSSSSISNVAVGKRLADSIQLLSDSLASKLKS